jgi:uncharacterized protein DUF2784
VNNVWYGLGDGIIAVHYAYLGYVLVGGFLAIRWPRTIAVHVLAVTWAVVIVTTKVPCPLTALQNQFRENAGGQPLSGSFIDLYVRGTFYPAGQQSAAQASLAVVVLASWIAFWHRHSSTRRTTTTVGLPTERP